MSKHPGGRPTKYKKEFPEKVREYIIKTNKKGNLPKRADLIKLFDAGEDAIRRWEKKYKEFRGVLSRLDKEQESVLLDKGLKNKWNSTIVKLVLHNHGYSDRNATDFTSLGKELTQLTDLNDEELDKRIAAKVKEAGIS